MDLVACAAAYSLTEPLISQTPAPSTLAATSVPAIITTSSYSALATSPTATASVVTTPASNHTKTTTSSTVQFTGAANQYAIGYGSLPALAIAAAGMFAL